MRVTGNDVGPGIVWARRAPSLRLICPPLSPNGRAWACVRVSESSRHTEKLRPSSIVPQDSGSGAVTGVRVQLPPFALKLVFSILHRGCAELGAFVGSVALPPSSTSRAHPSWPSPNRDGWRSRHAEHHELGFRGAVSQPLVSIVDAPHARARNRTYRRDDVHG
jgi:hypothetical protein